ncbi:MAG: hypothetical protein JXR42_05455 [Gammaproteobacteria bacterium]|nr:hypothetical protein [Gammaproteobacteria bacterium]
MDEGTRQLILHYHFDTIATGQPRFDNYIDVCNIVREKLGLDDNSAEDNEAQFDKDKNRFQTTCFFLAHIETTDQRNIKSIQLENEQLTTSMIGENFIQNYIHQSQYTVGPLSLIIPMNAEQSCSIFINEDNKDLIVSIIHNPTLLIPRLGTDLPLKIVITGEIYLLWDLSKSNEEMLTTVLCKPFLARLVEQDDILTVCDYFNFILRPPQSESDVITITPDKEEEYENIFEIYLKNLEFIKQYDDNTLKKSKSTPIRSTAKKDEGDNKYRP